MLSAALDAAALPCSDLERAKIRELKRRGAQFEQYEFPGFDRATSVAWIVDHSAAWFKDSEGNLLAIVQLPVGAVDQPDK
jgi:hypothetical protein